MTRFGGIFQAERLDLVLVQVWERDGSVRFGDHVTDTLYTRGVPDKHVPQFTDGQGVNDVACGAPIDIIKHFCTECIAQVVGLWSVDGSPER